MIFLKLYKLLFYRAYDLVQVTGKYDKSWGASHLLSLFFTFCFAKTLQLFIENLNKNSFWIMYSIHLYNNSFHKLFPILKRK